MTEPELGRAVSLRSPGVDSIRPRGQLGSPDPWYFYHLKQPPDDCFRTRTPIFPLLQASL